MCHHVALQVIHVDERYAQRTSKTFGKVDTHQKRAHEPRSSGKGNGRELFFRNAGTFYGFADYGNDILLVRSAGQLRHHASISFVDSLGCCHV
jgi:hypothetical protein